MKLLFISLPALSLRLLEVAQGRAPHLEALIDKRTDRLRALVPVEPAFGAASQATLLTGVLPQDHGVCALPAKPKQPTFWQRIQRAHPDYSVRCALWEPAFGLDTQGYERDTFPGNHANGERILEMLRASDSSDLITFRMAGIAHAARRSAPNSAETLRRLTSIDRLLGEVIEYAQAGGFEICICGEYAITTCDEALALELPAERVVLQDQVAHAWGDAEKIEAALADHPRVAQTYSGVRREQVGMHCDQAGDVVVFAKPGVSFEKGAGCSGLHQYAPLDQGALVMTEGFVHALGGELKPRVGACELSWLLERALLA